MLDSPTHLFDPPDRQQVLLLLHLSPHKRLRVMLEARELAVGLLRGRLHRRYPNLTGRELNLKVLEELQHARS